MKLVSVLLLAEAIVGSKPNEQLKRVPSHQIQHPRNLFKRKHEEAAIPKIDLSNMDSNTLPLEDFYQYVNGGWLKKNSIPSDRTTWSTFDEIRDRNEIVLKTILEEAANTSGDLLGDLYKSGMDKLAIEESGLDGIKDLFAGVESIKNEQDVLSFLGTLHSEGFKYSPFFKVEARPDSRDSTKVLVHLYKRGQGELSNEYQTFIEKMFIHANEKTPKKKAQNVAFVEEYLGDNYYYGDHTKRYNKITYTELKSLSDINWDGYFTNLGLKPNSFGDIVIDHPPFFNFLSKIITQMDTEIFKNYLKWYILKSTYLCLPQRFQDEGYNYYFLLLRGQQEPSPRWRIVRDLFSPSLGDELSKRFVEKVFPPKAKEEALSMVKFLQDALRERIENLDWMTNSTKKNALEKLKKLGVKIGYPDQWDDYSDIKFNRKSSFLHNIRQLLRRTKKKELDGVNKEVKIWQWTLESFDVNAYYSRDRNEIVLSAAIFQPPFFFTSEGNINAEVMAFNFGAIGAIIGHELTHGFDNQCRRYDCNGNFNDWWTKEDSMNFEERANTIISQFNALTFYNKRVDGEFTQGENIADLGGVKISYHAFQNWMKQYGEPKELHGFSPNQQFFIAYAQSRRNLKTKEQALMDLDHDPHSPEIHRVNQPLSNMQEFYDAFGEPNSGQGMYIEKKKRVQIW